MGPGVWLMIYLCVFVLGFWIMFFFLCVWCVSCGSECYMFVIFFDICLRWVVVCFCGFLFGLYVWLCGFFLVLVFSFCLFVLVLCPSFFFRLCCFCCGVDVMLFVGCLLYGFVFVWVCFGSC